MFFFSFNFALMFFRFRRGWKKTKESEILNSDFFPFDLGFEGKEETNL